MEGDRSGRGSRETFGKGGEWEREEGRRGDPQWTPVLELTPVRAPEMGSGGWAGAGESPGSLPSAWPDSSREFLASPALPLLSAQKVLYLPLLFSVLC